MKRLISLGIIILFILIAGCEKQPPTAVDSTNPTVQNQDTKNLKFDAAKMQKLMEAKLAKLKEMVKQQPESYHPKSLAKTTSGPINVPGDYSTIQEAVDAAADGAVINVTGSYTEDVVISGSNNITINGGGQATLTSNHVGFNIINYGYGLINHRGYGITGDVKGLTIKGFKIIGGIVINSSQYVTIKDNDISGPADCDGIDVFYGDANTISSNVVHNNSGNTGTADGIVLYHTNHNTVVDNQCYSNHDAGACGINEYYGVANEIKNNVVQDNTWGIQLYRSSYDNIADCKASSNTLAGIYLWFSNNNSVKSCETFQNDYGIILQNSAFIQINDANSHNNNDSGIDLYGSNSNTITGSKADNNLIEGGMYFDSHTNNNTIKDCEASGNGSCDVHDFGYNNIFTNCHFGSFNCTP